MIGISNEGKGMMTVITEVGSEISWDKEMAFCKRQVRESAAAALVALQTPVMSD